MIEIPFYTAAVRGLKRAPGNSGDLLLRY